MAPDTQLGFEPVIREIRKLRRTVWIVIVFLIICAGVFVAALLITPEKPRSAVREDSWLQVQAAIDRLEYDKAIAMAKRIVTRFPKDHNGHAQLGHISLIIGDVKAAESYYSKAYELFPGETYSKTLSAIRQRIQKEAESPQATATP